jgi:hypothetical protein
MEKEWRSLDTESLKHLYSSKAKELETYSAKGALKQFNEHKRMVADLAIELYKRLHRTLRFQAMDRPVREIKFY